MGNSYFKFKQFTVQQDRCAMKVCTDSCLFGALVQLPAKGNILDVGTGTGLLALMAAQRENIFVDAVEIDPLAAEQARENFAASVFTKRLSLTGGNLNDTTLPLYLKQYDCIISNPPFFENHLQPQDAAESAAKHTDALSYDDLLTASASLLKPGGILNVLLPFQYADTFLEKATRAGFYLCTRTDIKNFSNKPAFRSVLILGRTKRDTLTNEITIYTAPNEYTPEAHTLLQPFYLYL